MPATSPGCESITSALKPRAAAQRRYMRSSICAQSCASVPPAPAWMSRKALCESISPRNMRLSSRWRTSLSRRSRVALDVARGRLVVLRLGQLEQLRGVRDALGGAVDLADRAGEARALAPELLRARRDSDQTAGSSSSRATSSRRSFLRSYSKKPP